MDDGGGGKVEEIVGQAIEGRRDEVFLVSKVLPQNAPREGTIAACERSLRRLRTDHLDVYLLHWPGSQPLGDTIAGFEDLKHQGKILHYGVSNFGFPLLEKAIAIAGENAIACNQVSYHLKDREIEFGVIPFCEERRIALVGYSPFGQGYFPGDNPILEEIALRVGATPRQIALAFLLRFPHSFAIPKSSTISHVEENAAAGDLLLTEKDAAEIDEAF